MTQNDQAATIRRTMIRRGVLILAVLAMALPLSACGKKGSPEHPAESKYSRQYPAPEEKEEQQEQQDQALPKQGTVKPGGFIYEYPNRPPAK